MNTIEVRRKGGLPFVISGPLIPRKVLQFSYNLANLPESVEVADGASLTYSYLGLSDFGARYYSMGQKKIGELLQKQNNMLHVNTVR